MERHSLKREQDIPSYKTLCSLDNFERAFKRARRGKTLKPYVIEFEENLKENLQTLRTELLFHTYSPQPLKTFILRDPKTRKISKSAFRDRVIHHAICNIIEPAFDKTFIHDSYANRLGKGTHNAIQRFDTFKRKVSKNNTATCFVLKADIRHYFDTVDHDILLSLLKKKVKDEKIIWLIKRILENHKIDQHGKGMPLGNLTSQFFANVYLNELDQFVKHELHAKYYIRYVDDFVILDTSRNNLEHYKGRIETHLKEHLKLTLHPEKSQILKLEKGIGFLGFRIFFHHKLLQQKNLRKFKNKIEKMKHLYKQEKIEREKIIEKFEGWLTYASQANTYKYRRRITAKFDASFPVQAKINITSVKKHENFNNEIDSSKIEFSHQKTRQLIRKGLSIKQIAQARGIKEGTVWNHIFRIIEHYQLQLKEILPKEKIKIILLNIKSPDDTLKGVKERIFDDSITFNEIACVLANQRGKHAKKTITYFISWYQMTNCKRKCYHSKKQRQECRIKFQQFASINQNMTFTKKEFLTFFHDHVHICVLPDHEKKHFMSWREFRKNKHQM
ncbi:MAG: reverse transcriptase domain-containing protein [Nanoarchaeota archaeon]